MADEEQIDEEMEALLKEENQLDKVEPVTQALADMGTYWKAISEKLSKDNICYITKRKFEENEKFVIVQVPDHKLPPGMIAFVSVSKDVNTDE